jgi:hypothetical protein
MMERTKMDMKKYYRTSDLSEASFLYAYRKKLIRLDNDSGRIWFIFDDVGSCQELADSFWRKEASINAKEFADAIRSLKDMIFSRTRP